MTAEEMAAALMGAVKKETGITATAGIGSNLYLAKIAMDIIAKHTKQCIGTLTESSYRKMLWSHKPLSDFWQIGRKTERKLAQYGMYTMGDIAKMSLSSEDWLYRLFGIDAELLIDHAWGVEPCRMQDIKNYQSTDHSLSNGQVLMRNYAFEETLQGSSSGAKGNLRPAGSDENESEPYQARSTTGESRKTDQIERKSAGTMSQFAVYRVKDQTKALWHLSYFEVLEQKIPIREQDYQQIYLKHAKEWKNAMEIWKHLQDTVKISDVLTINQNGEVSAYYMDTDGPYKISGFFNLVSDGAAIAADTKDYQIEGYEGSWMVTDFLIMDGKQFYLMEHQKFHDQQIRLFWIVMESWSQRQEKQVLMRLQSRRSAIMRKRKKIRNR